ncbi:MAG: hypothetical protein AB1671_27820 [Thermodesulfobacteriota bacterium]|jgi:hypothetical protein
MAEVSVCRVFPTAQRPHRLPRRVEWLVFIQLHSAFSPPYARQVYRGGCGMETSSRWAGRGGGGTTTQNPAYRFVLLAFACVWLNVWMHLRWLFSRGPRRGRRGRDPTRLPSTRFAAFIRRTLEDLYGCPQLVIAPAVPRS